MSQSNSSRVVRRDFIKSAASVLAAAGAGSWIGAGQAQAAEARASSAGNGIEPGSVILFQGDSITDAGRSREKAGVANGQAGMGSGYAWLAAASLLTDRPKDGLKIFNRGISGHKVFQLAARWEKDCLELKPQVLSILIGVNDIWHTLTGNYQGTVEIYERDYRALLERTKKELPAAKLVICEPFVLKCGSVNDKWFPEFDAYRAAAARISAEFKTAWVPFQAMFDTAVEFAPPEHWAKDGVHPSPAGAALMAHTWLKTVGEI